MYQMKKNQLDILSQTLSSPSLFPPHPCNDLKTWVKCHLFCFLLILFFLLAVVVVVVVFVVVVVVVIIYLRNRPGFGGSSPWINGKNENSRVTVSVLCSFLNCYWSPSLSSPLLSHHYREPFLLEVMVTNLVGGWNQCANCVNANVTTFLLRHHVSITWMLFPCR